MAVRHPPGGRSRRQPIGGADQDDVEAQLTRGRSRPNNDLTRRGRPHAINDDSGSGHAGPGPAAVILP